MRGHIVKVTTGGRSLEEYLKGCNQTGQGLEAYLGEHSDGLRFHRYADGTKCSSKRLRDGGLEMLLDGRDPDSGELLKSFRAGNVRAYEIPLNDSKDLDVASVVYGDVREARMKAQARGEEAVRRFLAERLTVRLRCGDGRRRWVRPDEVMFVSATHFTSRAGDPELHRHLELINRVRVGDEWYSIDSSRLFGMYENIRSVYETTVYGDAGLCDAMAAHGMTLDMQGRVPELGNASDVFSKRRDAINARMAELVDEWRAAHADGMRRVRDPGTGDVVGMVGYGTVAEPDERTLMRLRLQAWADTRQAKGRWNTRVDYGAWNEELRAAGYDIPAMLAGAAADPRPRAVGFGADAVRRCAVAAVAALREMNSAWSLEQLEVAAYDQVRLTGATGTRDELQALAEGIRDRARELCVMLSEDPRARAGWVKSLTCRAVVECEDELKGRLAARGVEETANPRLDDLAERYTLDAGQREAVETICKGDPLAVVEGAAGAGKTHMLNAVNDYCRENGKRLVIATPTQKAALVVGEEVGTGTGTLMRLLEAYGWRNDETDPEHPWYRVAEGQSDHRGNTYRGVPDEYRLDRDTFLVVDEAGMMDQDQALALLRVADETGARLTLVGDTMQLNAVGRGGVMQLAERYTGNVVAMRDVHRFKDPDYAAYTIRLRERTPANAERLAGELFDRGMVRHWDSDEATVNAIAAAWMEHPDTTISTVTNRQAAEVNRAIQRLRLDAGQLGDERCASMIDGQEIHVGDIVMTRRNDNHIGVANRQTFAVLGIDERSGMLVGDGKRTYRLPAEYVAEAVQLGYASTTYGAQGVTSGHAIFYAAEGASGADAYVALTRGKTGNQVFMTAGGDEDALDTLTRIIARDKGDKGLEAAENSLREQIEQMAEPVDAGLNAEESSELRDLDRWLQERKTGLLQGADRRVWASEPLPELHAEIEREQRRAGELSERIRDMRDQYDTARSRAEHVADDYRDRLRELSDECGAALDAETARLERDMADDWRDVHRLLERHHEDETERLRLTDRNEPGYRSFVMGRRRLAGEATERANQSLMRYQAARAEFEDRWHIGYGEYRSSHELRAALARARAEETPAVTDLRDRMRDLEHERERDPEISAPERLRARVQELGNEYEEVLRTNADRRSMADIRQAETLGDRARLAALRDMRRPDAIDEYNSVLGRLEEGWGRGFWNELTGFREEHPNWGGWAMPVLRNDQFNYRDEFEPYFKEPEDIRYRDDAVLGTLVETAAYQRLDRDQLRTMTPRQIDQATRKLRKSLEVREHDRTAIDQAWQDAPRGEQITNDLAELERALGHRPGWADYTAMLRERETEHLLGYDDSQPSISYDADPFQATPTWSAGAGHGAGYGAGI